MNFFKSIIRKLPYYKKSRHIIRLIKAFLKNPQRDLPGSFYSPIPDLAEVRREEAKIFDRSKKEVAGINLNEQAQLSLLKSFKKSYDEIPFSFERNSQRYYYENSYFSYADAIILHCLIRHVNPSNIIEVGSGFSSCVMLDTNELFFNDSISCTFIEPFPVRLYSLLRKEDVNKNKILAQKVQDIGIDYFNCLNSGDILFIDSSHVSKVGSDVNYIFFDILPVLNKGVYIHIHDILFPFEYPKEDIYSGKSFNESYLLRSFLQFNDAFEIIYFNSFMAEFHSNFIKEVMPLCLKRTGGSIWLRKIA